MSMQIKPRKSVLRLAPAAAGFTLAGMLPLLMAAQAQALEFSFAGDEVSGSLNSTASYGQKDSLRNDRTRRYPCRQLLLDAPQR